MSNSLHTVIMAGGSGTRFWPASRSHRPKQFLPLARGNSLIGATVERLRGLVPDNRIWIVTNPTQAAALPDVLPDFPSAQIIVECEPRDTAPCIALATAHITAVDPDAVLAVMPADHLIEPVDDFHALLRRGAEIAANGETLVTFGIKPDRPATGYGYIEQGTALDDLSPKAQRVACFREKPDRATAEQYLASGRFLWNSGIFVWTPKALLLAMDKGAPELAAITREMLDAGGDRDSIDAAFRRAPKISIDYAVMEEAKDIAVVCADLDWHDLGSFLTLETVAPPDTLGNVQMLTANSQATLVESKNCVVYAEGDRTVALLGAEDLVVVAVGDAVLVCPKDRADDLKVLVNELKNRGRSDLL